MLRAGIAKYGVMRPECMNKAECDGGFEIELFSMVTNLMKVKLEIKFSSEAGCGILLPNGSWTGLVGMLQRSEIDIIANLCLLRVERMLPEWIDHSWPVLQQKQSFLIKAPEAKYEFNIFGPFQTWTWLTVMFAILCFVWAFTFVYKLAAKFTYKLSLKQAFIDVLTMISGLNVQPFSKLLWFCFVCFFGITVILYSTFITSAVLKPVAVYKPFKDSEELANVLYNGKYRILDYHTIAQVRCYENETCEKIEEAKRVHGYHYHRQYIQNPNYLLNELVTNPNLVLIRGRYQLRTYLNEFVDRNKLWLMNDESVGDDWLIYLFRKNATLKKLIDRSLIEIGSAKDHIKRMYLSQSYQTPDTATIKGQIPKVITMDAEKISSLIYYYIGGILLATFSLFSELLLKK